MCLFCVRVVLLGLVTYLPFDLCILVGVCLWVGYVL